MSDPCGNPIRTIIKKGYKLIILGLAILLLVRLLIENSSPYFRKLYYPLFSVHLNRQDVTLARGEEYKLRVIGINERVKFSSTDFRVAIVNFNGRIYALQTGDCFVIAKAGKKELKCRVRVLDLNMNRLTLKVGQNSRLWIKGPGGFPSYKSSNSAVAKVSRLGKVKAKARGRAVITVKARGKIFKCTVIVK